MQGLLKKIKEPITKKLFRKRFRVSRLKIDFCESDLKNKWPYKINSRAYPYYPIVVQ